MRRQTFRTARSFVDGSPQTAKGPWLVVVYHDYGGRDHAMLRVYGGEVISFWRMVILLAAEFASISPNLMELYFGFSMGGKDAPTPEELRSLERAIELCKKIGWFDLANQGTRLLERARSSEDEGGEGLKALAADLRSAFHDKTDELYVVAIDPRDTGLFMDATKALCGGPLHVDVSVSSEELNLAGRALALGLSTAAVSHAMRAVEAGLHSLCHKLGVTFPGTVELQDWVNLTEKVQSEISRLEKQPRGPQKTEELKRFSGLLISADAFRLAWRNHVAHAREKYETEETRRILGHVGEFLKRLSAAL